MPDYDNSEAIRRSELVEAKAAEMQAAIDASAKRPDVLGVKPAPAPKVSAKKKSADE